MRITENYNMLKTQLENENVEVFLFVSDKPVRITDDEFLKIKKEDKEQNINYNKTGGHLYRYYDKLVEMYGPVRDWDTSFITDVKLFRLCTYYMTMYSHQGIKKLYIKFSSFDITKWDVSQVRNFDYMFCKNWFFNQDISNWNTENAISMKAMFDGCNVFNHSIEH